MSKALIVLAACVDARSGKRLATGDMFIPAPSVEQAKRLVVAGCLSEAAIDVAAAAEAEVEKAAEKKAKAEAKEKAKADAEAKQAAEKKA